MVQQTMIGEPARVAVTGKLSQHYLTLCDELRHISVSGRTEVLTIGLISCFPGEGVGTVAANLAVTAATLFESNVLLIDARPRCPALETRFEVTKGAGLADVVCGSSSIEDAVQATNIPNLAILGTGTEELLRCEVVSPSRFADVLASIESDYGLVIVALSPLTRPDSCGCWSMASDLDGILMVLESERVSARAAQTLKRRLLRLGANPLGVVFNQDRNSHFLK